MLRIFLLAKELIKEYEQCYFSFIIESCNNEEGTMKRNYQKKL